MDQAESYLHYYRGQPCYLALYFCILWVCTPPLAFELWPFRLTIRKNHAEAWKLPTGDNHRRLTLERDPAFQDSLCRTSKQSRLEKKP